MNRRGTSNLGLTSSSTIRGRGRKNARSRSAASLPPSWRRLVGIRFPPTHATKEERIAGLEEFPPLVDSLVGSKTVSLGGF